MKTWLLLMVLVIGMALGSLNTFAKSTVIVNETCNNAENWNIVGVATINGLCTWSGSPNNGLVYVHELLNLSTNNNNFTLEIYNYTSENYGHTYYLMYQSNNSNLAIDTNTIMIRGLNVDEDNGGENIGDGQKITMFNSSSQTNLFITSSKTARYNLKLQFRLNNSIDILVNETNKGNLNLQGLQSNGSFLILKADSVAINSMDGFALYNGTSTDDSADSTPPLLNSSLNITSINQNSAVNISGNISDNIGLSFCEIINNQSGTNTIYNFTLTGTSGFCSQNMTISLGINEVINFTIRVNDTSNNFVRTSTILTVGDATVPSFTNVSINNITSYTSTQKINITAVVTDASPLNFIRCTTNTSDIHTNNTLINIEGNLWAFASTFAVADYNIPYCYAQDTSLNLQQENTNIKFSVTAGGGGGGSDSSSSGGGGGGITIIEEKIIILGNLTLTLKPPIINTFFIYTPFKKTTQRFAITLLSNKALDKCTSSRFECNIINNNTVTVAFNYSNDTAFFSKIEDTVTLFDKASFAKTIDAKVKFINIGYAVPVSLDTKSSNYAVFRLQDGLIAGIRAWFIIAVIIAMGAGIYLYETTR